VAEREEFQLFILRSIAFASSISVPKKSIPQKEIWSHF